MIYNAPTQKQIKYAKDISARTGIPLPEKPTFDTYRDYIWLNKDAPDAPSVSINQGTGEAKITLYVKKCQVTAESVRFINGMSILMTSQLGVMVYNIAVHLDVIILVV